MIKLELTTAQVLDLTDLLNAEVLKDSSPRIVTRLYAGLRDEIETQFINQ